MAFRWDLTAEGPQTEEFGHRWALAARRRRFDTTPELAQGWEKVRAGMRFGDLQADFWIDKDATPKLAEGAQGVALLYLDTASGSKLYTVQAVCLGLTVLGQGGPGNLQLARYTFAVSLLVGTSSQTAGIVAT